MTNLSPAAQAVWDAFNEDEPGVFIDYGDCLAAALRAAAEQIEDRYCDTDESNLDDSLGIVFAMRQLMLIAAELKGAQ